MGGNKGEFQDLTNRLLDRAAAYGMEVSTEKSKVMTNSANIDDDDDDGSFLADEDCWEG